MNNEGFIRGLYTLSKGEKFVFTPTGNLVVGKGMLNLIPIEIEAENEEEAWGTFIEKFNQTINDLNNGKIPVSHEIKPDVPSDSSDVPVGGED